MDELFSEQFHIAPDQYIREFLHKQNFQLASFGGLSISRGIIDTEVTGFVI